MKIRRFDVQVLIVLVFVGLVFIAAFFIRVAQNPFGLFAEPNELTLYCDDLVGLQERAEVRCRGAVLGHVKSIQWGTRGVGLAGLRPRAIRPNGGMPQDATERFWIRAGLNEHYGTWKFARTGYIRGAVMQSAVTPSWIELVPAGGSEMPVTPGSSIDIQLIVDKTKPGAEGLAEKMTQIGDEILDLMHVLNPPAPQGEGATAQATPPIKKIVTMIDDLSDTTHSLHQFAVRLQEKASDEELSKALAELKDAVAKLHEHVTEADGAVQETREAMMTFKKAAKKTDLSATKFNDLVDRVGDTTLGRALIRKKSPTPTPKPR